MNLRFEMEKSWRLATAALRPLPSFVIAGAPKCGTSTLYNTLAMLPGIRRGWRKEPTNFVHYPGSRFCAAMNYPIRLPGARFIVGDGSVEYFTHPEAPKNVREIVPDARLIFLLRDPVCRAWSDYQMFRKSGGDTADFSKTVLDAMRWLDDPTVLPLADAAAMRAWHPARYVLCGWYARALERWFSVFPREQCLVMFSEELFSNPAHGMTAVLQHIGMPMKSLPNLPKSRDGGYDDWMPLETERAMREFFQPRNHALAALLGRELPWE
ncbi:MAG: sulfotransferase domain-containing protein [Chthoniobacterales bacterium]